MVRRAERAARVRDHAHRRRSTSATSVFELPPSTREDHREHLAAMRSSSCSAIAYCADQRMGEQRLLHVERIAAERRARRRAARRPRRAASRPSSSGASGGCSSGSAPDRVTRAGTSTTSSSASPASVAVVPHVDLVHRAVAGDERRDEPERGLAVERAAALLEQRGLLDRGSGRGTARSSSRSISATAWRAGRRRAARAAPRRARRSSGGSTTAHAELVEQAPRQPELGCDLVAVRRRAGAGSTSSPSSEHAAHPRQVVEPDLVDDDALRLDAELTRPTALEADRDVAEPDRPVVVRRAARA